MNIIIHTKLEKYNFLNQLISLKEDEVEGLYSLNGEFFILVESMAQLASLHFRKLNGDKRQTFLLKIKALHPWKEEMSINGVCKIKAKLLGKSRDTGIYEVMAKINKEEIKGTFMISSLEKEIFLEKH